MGKLILVIHVGDFLPSAVLDDEASAAEFFNGSMAAEATRGGMSSYLSKPSAFLMASKTVVSGFL